MSGNGANGRSMVDVRLARIVIREGVDHHFIFLTEKKGKRGFPIVIGTAEAAEIRRVVTNNDVPPRPLTHQLAHAAITSLGARIERVDIVDLKNNTFYARLCLRGPDGREAEVDARPSDAIALALRASAALRVAEHVLEQVRADNAGPPDPLPPAAAEEGADDDDDEDEEE